MAMTYSYRADVQEIAKRVVKYAIEAVAVAWFAFLLSPKLKNTDVLVLALVAAATFSALDLVSPSVSMYVRQGAGFGMGANLVGFPAIR